jgi:hypothetical protein
MSILLLGQTRESFFFVLNMFKTKQQFLWIVGTSWVAGYSICGFVLHAGNVYHPESVS